MGELFRTVGGVTAWLSNASFVALTTAGITYAFAPDAQRWVELNMFSRTAYFYIGTIDGAGAEGKFRDAQFYSTRWNDDGVIDMRKSQGEANIWTVVRRLKHEIVIVRTPKKESKFSFEPVPGRREPSPTGDITLAAVDNECYFVHDVVCVTYDGGRKKDPECIAAESSSRRQSLGPRFAGDVQLAAARSPPFPHCFVCVN